jgi:hypothetical protein
MEAVRTSETSVDNQFTRQYNPEDSSEHHTRHRENLKSHITGNTVGSNPLLIFDNQIAELTSADDFGTKLRTLGKDNQFINIYTTENIYKNYIVENNSIYLTNSTSVDVLTLIK